MEKIILHAHSNWSHDSKITLEEWKTFMKDNNISKVYLTEHEESGWSEKRYKEFKLACNKFSSVDHKLVPGLELNIRGFHVLAPNLYTYDNRPDDNNIMDIKKWVEHQGSILIAAHPDKYQNDDEELLKHCHGIEIINTKHQYNWFLRRPSSKCFNLMKKFNLSPYIGQDIHKLSQYDPKGISYELNNQPLILCSNLQGKRATLLNDNLLSIKNTALKTYKNLKRIGWI